MKTLKTHLRNLLAIWSLFFFSAATLPAATIVWTNTTSGSFGIAANWSPNAVPGSVDVAIITNTGTYKVTLATGTTLAGLQLGSTNGADTNTLDTSGQTLTLNGGSIINSSGLLKLSSNLGASGANVTNNGD
ncbi:MAG: hypothetical protein WDM80_17115, partial [Limisphaerales bacterium]